MNKILIIGCPGSGKSTLARKIQKVLGYKILHLDYIYHIDNNNQITKEEFRQLNSDFVHSNEKYIIDGNYTGTLEFRLETADTVIFYQIDTETCVSNVLNRLLEPQRDDMAPGFDNSIMDDDFLDYIRNFNTNNIPRIESVLRNYPHIKVIRLHNYEEANNLLESLR